MISIFFFFLFFSIACPVGCLTCSIPNFSVSSQRSDLICSACHDGYVLSGGQCQPTCIKGTFLPSSSTKASNGTCQCKSPLRSYCNQTRDLHLALAPACDTSVCSTCVSSSTTCLTCADTTLLSTPTGSCVSTCPSGTYQLLASRVCATCPGSCATCSSSSDGLTATCLTCTASRPVLRNGRCEETCPTSQFWDSQASSCSSCSTNCTSCFGPTSNQCLSCTTGSIMKGGMCESATCAVDGWVDSLGVCFTSIVYDGKVGKDATWWPYILALCLFGLVAGLVGFWWIRRERKRTRERTEEFGFALDEAQVGKNVKFLGLNRGNDGESQSPTSPHSARSGLFTFLSARSPPSSPLKNSSPRTPKIGASKLDESRESFFAGPAPPAYSPTDTSFVVLETKAKALEKRLSDYRLSVNGGNILDQPASTGSFLPSGPSSRRASNVRWVDLMPPPQAAEGSGRDNHPLLHRAQTEADLDMEETRFSGTRDKIQQDSVSKVFKRSLSGTVSAFKKGSIDQDSSWLFEPGARAPIALPRVEAREEGVRGGKMQGLMEALSEGPVGEEASASSRTPLGMIV
jgi:hypothetical protein